MEIPVQKFKDIYGSDVDILAVQSRYSALADSFLASFAEKNADFFSASGRIEICGNHTDHNCGKVLVAAIGMDTLAAASISSDNCVTVISEGYPAISADINCLKATDSKKGTSLALIEGVLFGLKERGYKIGGAKISMCSTVFKGAGVSSSASYELVITEIMNYCYNNGKIPPIEKAQISQFAENVFFGKPCGLLDQAGIALGSLTEIDFADVKQPICSTIDADFSGYKIVITNTGGDHSNLTPSYAAIRQDMEKVAAYFGKKVLRQVNEQDFYAKINELYKIVGGRGILRAIHFFEENKRVERAAAALKNSDLDAFFIEINASGDSSYKCLQNCYVEATYEQQIPLALALSKRILGGRGAVRVHGGGFAGTIIAYVPTDIHKKYTDEMQRIFGSENVFTTFIRKGGATKV